MFCTPRAEHPTPPFSTLPCLRRSVFLTSLGVCDDIFSYIFIFSLGLIYNLLPSHANGDRWWRWMVCRKFLFLHGSIFFTTALSPSPHRCPYYCAHCAATAASAPQPPYEDHYLCRNPCRRRILTTPGNPMLKYYTTQCFGGSNFG